MTAEPLCANPAEDEPYDYFEVLAGTEDNPGAILAWGWGSHADAQPVATALLGHTLTEAFDLLGADGQEPYTLEADGGFHPCVSADWPDEDDDEQVTVVAVVKIRSSTTTVEERELSRITTRLRLPLDG